MNPQTANEIQTVDVLSQGEQIAFVMTKTRAFVVGSIPAAGTDVHDAGILKEVNNIDEARKWWRRQAGVTP